VAEESTALTVAETRAIKKALKSEIQGLARYLVEDPLYIEGLLARMRNHTLHPTLQSKLMDYAYGKPKERIEISEAKIVRIIHEFQEEPKVIEGEVVEPTAGTTNNPDN